MSPSSTSASAAPLPPLPDFSGGEAGASSPQNPMQALVSGIAPIKKGVDDIIGACKAIAQSGVVPGAEQVCGQIVALATSLLPMAAQQVLQPGGGGVGAPAPPPGGLVGL